MDEPAPKRRRTSPRLAATATSDAPAPEATPQSARARGDRPSFASPTKASLARHNPQILERRRSASPAKPESSRTAARSTTSAAAQLGQSLAPLARQAPAAEDPLASEPQQEEEDEEEDEDEVAREEGSTPSSGRAVRKTRGSLAAAPRASLDKPNPRPLPPPGPEGEDELSPFVDRDLQLSRTTGVPIVRAEPELPPSVSDPISSTPPRGIHSSPSRWRGKSKPKKSSPLKPHAEPPGQAATGGNPSSFLRRVQSTRDQSEAVGEDSDLDELSHPARMVPAFDRDADKRKERDALQKEILSLRKDLESARRESERIRLMQTSGRELAPTDEDAILDILRRHMFPDDANTRPIQSQQLVKAALNPMALLPFGKLLHTVAPTGESDELALIQSHHPVAMTAEEELPYLQLFSPFDISSDIAVLPQEPGQALRQRHSIQLRSRDSPAIFHARIEMIVDAFDLTILDLRVPAIHPAAKAELGPFIEKICTDQCNRSMQRNVGILSWAMAEWHRVSAERADLWIQLDKETASKESVLDLVERLKEKRATQGQDDEDDEDETSNSKAESQTRTDILRYLGQQYFDISVPSSESDDGCTVRLEWKIGFDWTGAAKNDVSVKLNVPAKWHHNDRKGALDKFPSLFDDLVRGDQEPGTAVKTIVALLVDE